MPFRRVPCHGNHPQGTEQLKLVPSLKLKFPNGAEHWLCAPHAKGSSELRPAIDQCYLHYIHHTFSSQVACLEQRLMSPLSISCGVYFLALPSHDGDVPALCVGPAGSGTPSKCRREGRSPALQSQTSSNTEVASDEVDIDIEEPPGLTRSVGWVVGRYYCWHQTV